jgi:Leucine-rich repeat (LRR) protein
VPASLSVLTNLRYLTLDSNSFTGTIPVELGELTSLYTLWLAYNPFEPRELPASFKNLTNLVSLWLANCSLVGNFPSYFVTMQKLVILDLSDNSLSGNIPPGMWSLKKLRVLFVYGNNLTGPDMWWFMTLLR